MQWCLLALLAVAGCVDHSKFRTCKQTSFCDRNRNFVTQDYEIVPSSVVFHEATSTVDAYLANTRHPLQEPLAVKIQVLQNEVLRFSVREKSPRAERWEVPDVLENPALQTAQGAEFTAEVGSSTLSYGAQTERRELKLTHKPFSAALSLNGEEAITLNSEGKMNFELLRDANPLPAEESERKSDKDMVAAYDTEGMWVEKFGSHTDSKPRGPEAVALDIGFGSQHLYGIPEHASDFALKNTDGTGGGYSEPYRLFNLDVFEYDLDVPMALYGTVPFMMSHDERKTTGMLWLNSAETFVDVSDGRSEKSRSTHWISESGIIDMFLMASPRPADISLAYASLTGFAAMPQRFAIAYHQCRWNYKDEADVAAVDAGFDEHDIPYDVLWLDIEHTDAKKYFTWDKANFPNPKEMQNKIAAKGRKMVTIIDPHIKRDANYHVHTEALAKDLYIHNKDSNTYEGWCWPGSVSYLDFNRPEVRDYWISLFALEAYEGSTPNLYTWNDMNEPSVFNGPEVTMQKDNLHMGDRKVEHRNVHNMYGFYHQMASAQGLEKRDNARPFVLTRSFFAGSQKYGAVWTGDNMAKWSHLEAATPMLLSLNVAGIVFSGADVGGFFGDPDPELLLRWYQLAAFQPFYRGHAHIDAKRREPWLFGEPWTAHIRTAIRRRYAYLPYLYSVFQESTRTGKPINRPLWYEFPEDRATFGLEQEFLLGDALLIKAVTAQDQTSTSVYLPQGAVWYDVVDGKQLKGGVQTTLDTPLDRLPVLQRGGTIVPKRERARRSSAAMDNDPFTLVVAVDEEGHADGSLYLDDGHSFDYKQGQFLRRRFIFDGTTLSSVSADPAGVWATDLAIERVVIYGLPSRPLIATLTSGGVEAQVTILGDGAATVLRKPDAKLTEDWTIALQF